MDVCYYCHNQLNYFNRSIGKMTFEYYCKSCNIYITYVCVDESYKYIHFVSYLTEANAIFRYIQNNENCFINFSNYIDNSKLISVKKIDNIELLKKTIREYKLL